MSTEQVNAHRRIGGGGDVPSSMLNAPRLSLPHCKALVGDTGLYRMRVGPRATNPPCAQALVEQVGTNERPARLDGGDGGGTTAHEGVAHKFARGRVEQQGALRERHRELRQPWK